MHDGHEHSHSHVYEHIQGKPGNGKDSSSAILMPGGQTQNDSGFTADPLRKITALLSYTLEHNRAHVEELRALAHEIAQAGEQENCAEAARLVLEAAADFDRGNEKLAGALSCLK